MRFCTLVILDGFGENKNKKGNAIRIAGTPFIDSLKQKYPTTYIDASGEAVGKVAGQMGDSEVGHMNMGSGRVVMQNILLINKAIEDKSFFTNPRIMQVMNHVKENNSSLHLFGLLSDGGVHSMYQHLFAYIKMAKLQGIKKVYIHAITDGRDTGTHSAKNYIDLLEKYISKVGVGVIASICGRVYAMDREKNYDRIEKFYNALVYGKGKKFSSANEAIESSYKDGTTDEFVMPSLIEDNGVVHTLKDNDGVIFFNYRKDRAKQILEALTYEDFDKFHTEKFKNIKVLTPIMISKDLTKVLYAFDNQLLKNGLSEYLSKLGYSQLKVSETTKYAHVTYYFNGAIEDPFVSEDRRLFPSDNLQNFAEKPKMQADKVSEYVVEATSKDKYKLIVVNICNGDMIGHTGDMQASLEAVKVIDKVTEKMVNATLENGGFAIVTADHGNIEQMFDSKGEPFTAHTTNKVPFIVVDDKSIGKTLSSDGKLADIAPTILDLLGLEVPVEMNGKSLLN